MVNDAVEKDRAIDNYIKYFRPEPRR